MSTKIIDDIDGTNKKQVDEEEEEEYLDLMFKVKIEKQDPPTLKISKKNVCIVTIVDDKALEELQNTHNKMV